MQNEPVFDFVWTEQLSVGNAILDSDHKKLLELAGNIDRASKAMDLSAMLYELKRFNACMKQHFLNEELLAHALGIPFVLHQQDHRNISAEIELSICELENGAMEHYAQFLKNWLAGHISEKDMLMKPILRARPYSFRIEGVGNFCCSY